MIKIFKILLILIFSMSSLTLLSSCNLDDLMGDSGDEKTEETENKQKEYNVVFMVDDELYHRITIKQGEQISLPSDPIKDGYVFSGWYSDYDLTNEFNFDVFVASGNLVLYAKFESIKAHVCEFGSDYYSDEKCHWFMCSCGAIDKQEPHYGGEATTTELAICEVCYMPYGELLIDNDLYLINPNDGNEFSEEYKMKSNGDGSYYIECYLEKYYTFQIKNNSGTIWYTDTNLIYGESADRWTGVVAILEAGYYRIEVINGGIYVYFLNYAFDYLVEYYVDGNLFHQEKMQPNTWVLYIEPPMKEGYTFIGWYYNGYLYDYNQLITSDIKLEAVYEKVDEETPVEKEGFYLLSSDYNHGYYEEFKMVQNDDNYYLERHFDEGFTFYIEDSRYGKVFGDSELMYGENTQKCPGSIKILLSGLYRIEFRNLGIYVYYIEEGTIYTVEYYVDGMLYHSYPVKEYSYITPYSAPVKRGYKFIGWYYNGYLWDFNQDVKCDLKFDAVYEMVTLDIDEALYVLSPNYNNDFLEEFKMVPNGDGSFYLEHYFDKDFMFQIQNAEKTLWYGDGELVDSKYASMYPGGIIILLSGLYRIELKDNQIYVISIDERVSYNVEYYVDGMLYHFEPVWENTYITPYGAPNKTWFEFLGWYFNGVLYDFNKVVTSDLKLEAAYKEINFDSTLDLYVLSSYHNGEFLEEFKMIYSGDRSFYLEHYFEKGDSFYIQNLEKTIWLGDSEFVYGENTQKNPGSLLILESGLYRIELKDKGLYIYSIN